MPQLNNLKLQKERVIKLPVLKKLLHQKKNYDYQIKEDTKCIK